MKQVRIILIGTVLIFIHTFTTIGLATELNENTYLPINNTVFDFNLHSVYQEHLSDYSEYHFIDYGTKIDFLLRHKLDKNYIIGIKYIDLDVENDRLRKNNDSSQLWVGLQFTF